MYRNINQSIVMLITGATFLYLGNEIISRNPTTAKESNNRWRAFFGVSPAAAADMWNALDATHRLPAKGRHQHLLWCLAFLKMYDAEIAMLEVLGVGHEQAHRKWAW